MVEFLQRRFHPAKVKILITIQLVSFSLKFQTVNFLKDIENISLNK